VDRGEAFPARPELLHAAVLAVIVQASTRVRRRALNRPGLVALAVAAFLASTVLAVRCPS
jgi:chromate transporter